jgi:hypothetical protein
MLTVDVPLDTMSDDGRVSCDARFTPSVRETGEVDEYAPGSLLVVRVLTVDTTVELLTHMHLLQDS